MGILEGAGAVLLGFLLGRLRRREKRGPACGCGHQLSYHDERRGCRAQVRSKGLDGIFGDTETCRCTRYSGPEPLPDYFAPEIS